MVAPRDVSATTDLDLARIFINIMAVVGSIEVSANTRLLSAAQ